MALPNGDIFSVSGPYWIPPLHWWLYPDHKRSVIACLVKGAYLLEKDRKAKREYYNGTALAPPWWLSFGFRLHRCIIDDRGSYIGAVYQYMMPTSPDDQGAPRYVVAFRGTITKGSNFFSDMKHNLNLIINRLRRKSRSIVALQAVLDLLVQTSGYYNRVWLAGHSLGSSMAMLVGKHMARINRVYLDCFLFNPPFISLPIGLIIKNEEINRLIRVVNTTFVFFTALVTKTNLNIDRFQALSRWRPHLFVHPQDPICLEYIDYLKKRKWKDELGIGGIDRLAARNSFLGFLFRNDAEGEEPLHLIPSANLTVNVSPESQLCDAHGLKQWWKHDLKLEWSDHGMDPEWRSLLNAHLCA